MKKLRRISKGRFKKHIAQKDSFADYINRLYNKKKLNVNRHIMCLDEVCPDYFYISYENLHEDMESLFTKLGLPYDKQSLPTKKTHFRKGADYRSHYDDRTIEIVKNAYQMEIQHFGYTF